MLRGGEIKYLETFRDIGDVLCGGGGDLDPSSPKMLIKSPVFLLRLHVFYSLNYYAAFSIFFSFFFSRLLFLEYNKIDLV